MALRKFLILRRQRQRPSRRTHGADPADSNFLPSLSARPEDGLREAIPTQQASPDRDYFVVEPVLGWRRAPTRGAPRNDSQVKVGKLAMTVSRGGFQCR
jgi:hypothetical protein